MDTRYQYSSEPTRNPLRYAAAAWRLVRNDPAESTADAAVVELGFARSKLGRRFARWSETLAHLANDPGTRRALDERCAFGPIDLAELEPLPPGTLGGTFARHCRARGIDPNLVHVPPDDEVGWFLNHLYQTHDIWHVVTGWGNDLEGEVGLGGFYSAQLGAPAFFGYMHALVLLNVLWRRADLATIDRAWAAGLRMGDTARPLFGTDWGEHWERPLAHVRAGFAIDTAPVVGEGIADAA